MAGPTFWEVHEYNAERAPVLAFVAGAGGHAAADEFGTTFYVHEEEGWRDGAALREHTTERLGEDGSWNGALFKDSFLVTLYGYWQANSLEGAQSSMRRARNVLGRQFRTGRLLAHDSDNRRLYADVTRGGRPTMTPLTQTYGEWDMTFQVTKPIYLSEELRSTELRTGGPITTGRAYPYANPRAYQTANTARNMGVIVNGGDVPTNWTAEIYGPVSRFTLSDSVTGRALVGDVAIPNGSKATLDTASRTFLLNGQNVRWKLTGDWFSIAPGESNITFTPVGTGGNTKCIITYNAEAWGG